MTTQLTFDDEFNNLSLWNGSAGTWATTYWWQDQTGNGTTLATNGEQQWYINDRYGPTSGVRPWGTSDGVLTLTAAPASSDVSSQINGYAYTSGMLNTYHSFSQTYGYFEMRAELPAGQGLWPAFWLLPKDGSWPPELDVMEMTGDNPNKLVTTAHSNASGAHTFQAGGTLVDDMSAGFHTYGVDWEADKITWYFDGKQVYQVDTPADMHKPMYVMANLAVGGNWPGSPNASTAFPAKMEVDYIRAWSGDPYANGTTPTSAASSPAPAGGQDGTDGPDVLNGGDNGANVIRGLGGDDRITGGVGGNDINGNLGADTLIGRSQVGDTLRGGQGEDLIDVTGSGAHNEVNGNLGNDTVRGGSGGDTLRGGQGDDLIVGGSGSDWISGDRGHDTVSGGGGADIFHTFSGAGVSVVQDFSASEGDRVHVESGAQFTVSEHDGSVYVDVAGGGELILQHASLGGLPSGWIFS